MLIRDISWSLSLELSNQVGKITFEALSSIEKEFAFPYSLILTSKWSSSILQLSTYLKLREVYQMED